ncbi:MAG: (Fe-S)-binding protein [Dehalococcoidia bacterium]
MMASTKEKIKKIYEVLPKLDCGMCGFGGCGQFARAVAEGRASPFGCRQNPQSGFEISKIVGSEVRSYASPYLSRSGSGMGAMPSQESREDLKSEIKDLSSRIDRVLERIESLKN